MMYTAVRMRSPVSMNAEKFSNLPWPYGWRSSAGWSETRTERNVMTAATRSRPECSASERMPRLSVRMTRKVFRQRRRAAEPMLNRAARFFSWMAVCRPWGRTMNQDYNMWREDAERGEAGVLFAILFRCPRNDRCVAGIITRNKPFSGVKLLRLAQDFFAGTKRREAEFMQ